MREILLALVPIWPLLLLLRSSLWFAVQQSDPQRLGPRPPLLDAWWVSAPLPAILLALWPGESELAVESWMLGGLWQLDEARRPWLLFAALLWGVAGWYARGYLAEERHGTAHDDGEFRRLLRFALLWPLTLAGNLLLIVAEDIPSFYLGFVTMTLSAYGLVVHTGEREARHGGFAYLVMALLGEAMILAGLLWAAGSGEALTLTELRASVTEAEQGLWMATLLWLGFGVKAGVAGLHVWLPLAHPVAPTPASAVLSGVMVKAGLLGWLSTLPLGSAEAGLAPLGEVIIVAGLAGAFAAALLGVAQRQPKAVLAYSSVSQLGMIASLVGAGMSAPMLWPALAPAVTLFAAHHGMTKGALFLGVGISEHPPRLPAWLTGALLTLPALSLSGAFASGLMAKEFMKKALHDSDHATLATWLSVAAVGTTVLMTRALWRQWQERGEPAIAWRSPMALAWLVGVMLAAGVPLWLPLGKHVPWPPLADLPGLLWPAALGLGLAGLVLVAASLRHGEPRVLSRLQAGDLWWSYAALARWVLAGLAVLSASLEAWNAGVRSAFGKRERRMIAALDDLTHFESHFRRLAIPLMVSVGGLLLLGFWLGSLVGVGPG